jgi:hypothetical protein
MAKIIETEVFTYDELKERSDAKAIEKAANWLREAITDGDWHAYILELWQSALSQVGFENPSVSYSGFWSQGDGASFTATIDVAKLAAFMSAAIEPSETISGEPEDFRPYIVHKCGGVRFDPRYAKLIKLASYIGAEVRRTAHHYSHENTCTTYIDLSGSADKPRVEKLLTSFREDVETLRGDLSRAMYRSLEQEYDYQHSEESISDFAEANEYTFTVDGKRFG